jgi:hypothetical protein
MKFVEVCRPSGFFLQLYEAAVVVVVVVVVMVSLTYDSRV